MPARVQRLHDGAAARFPPPLLIPARPHPIVRTTSRSLARGGAAGAKRPISLSRQFGRGTGAQRQGEGSGGIGTTLASHCA